MNAAKPELRSAVMTVVEASWDDAAGLVHAEPARMEDKSSSGACLRLKSPLEVGDRLRVRWRFEQFSGVVKYCRSERGEFVIGIQRDKGELVSPGQESDSKGKMQTSLSTERESGVAGEGQMASEKAAKVQNAKVATAIVDRQDLEIEERRRTARSTPVEEKPQSDARESEVREQHEAHEERKPMKRKWLDLTPWNSKQEGPSVRGNGTAGGGGTNEGRTGDIGLGGLTSGQRMMSDAGSSGDAAFTTDLLVMEDVYLTAGVMQPRGRGVNKVIEMLRSAHMRGMSEEMKRAAVLMALEVAGITVYQIQRDAKARQDALDAYEVEQNKQAELQWARKAEENGKIQADLGRVQEQYLARIARNLEVVAQEQALFRNWQALKRQEAQKIQEAVDLCVKPVAAEIAVVPLPAPVEQKAQAAAAAESVGGIKPS